MPCRASVECEQRVGNSGVSQKHSGGLESRVFLLYKKGAGRDRNFFSNSALIWLHSK